MRQDRLKGIVMARYQVKCSWCRDVDTPTQTWTESVEASDEVAARDLAKDKAKLKYPDGIIAVVAIREE